MKAGWVSRQLKEIGEIQTGTTPPTKNKEYYGNFIPFIKPPHFNLDGSFDYQNTGLSIQGLKKGRLIRKNSILMVCIGASIGKTGITNIPVSCNQQINAFTPNKNLCPRFFYYLLSSADFFKKVKELSSQATLPMINKTKWQGIVVSLPESLSEQEEIVRLLDSAFAKIDQARANLKQNIANAKELFQAKLNEIFSRKGKGWEEKSLGEVVNISSGGTPSKKEPIFWGGDIPWVSPKDMKFLQIENSRDKITLNALEAGRAKLLNIDTVLIVVRSGILSRTIPVGITKKKVTINQDLKALKPKSEILPLFLLNFLRANETFLLSKVTRGATVHRIETPVLKQLKICFPEKRKQIELNILAKTLEKQKNDFLHLCETKLQNLEELKKSLLQKAFVGELTNESVPA